MDSFGTRLKREREKRGVTLDEISVATKIGTRMLRALEEEKFDQLPGGIFNKGFVRAYAQQVGMDEEQAIADYLTAIGENPQDNAPDSAPQAFPLEIREERPRSEAGAGIPWGWFAIALLLVAIAFVVWSMVSRKPLSGAAPQPAPEVVAANASAAKTAPAATHVAAAPVTPAKTTPQNTVPQNETKPAVKPATPTPVPGSFTVRMVAREDSWVSISVDGQKIMQGTLVAPAEKSAAAREEIIIRAGNVGALGFFFNGKELPAQGELGEAKTLIFNSRGLQPAPVQPAVPPG